MRKVWAALEPLGKPEAFPGDPVENLLTEVPERRVTEVVGASGGLHDDRIASAQCGDRTALVVGAAPETDRNGPRDRGDLERMGQPVVDRCGRPGHAPRLHHLLARLRNPGALNSGST
jgi:hypothetical protein